MGQGFNRRPRRRALADSAPAWDDRRSERPKREAAMRALYLVCCTLALLCGPAAGDTLSEVKARGAVRCGTTINGPGWAYTDAQGVMRGFDVDFCRALGAAIFGDAAKAVPVPVPPVNAFATLAAGEIDLLNHRFTWTFNRDNGIGIETLLVLFHDGQGFMVPKSLGVAHIAALDGASICAAQGTTTELNIADYFAAHRLSYKIVSFANADETRIAYEQGRCDAWSNDASSLATRLSLLRNPAEHMILPEIISKEPVGPMVRQGDDHWAHLVRWTYFALIEAEELGISSGNVAAMRRESGNPEIKRLLGSGDDLGQKLGLAPDWAFNAILQVGNYGEIFARNLGAESPIGLARGRNELWSKGGLIFSPPFR
jgi:general L-amino acid transport system substrate-binding protein